MNDKTDEPLSRSQRKRDAQDVLTLATELVDCTPAQLDRLPLDGELLDSIDHIKSISSHIARKREIQYLAKLLRGMDYQAIADRLDDLTHSQVSVSQQQHLIELWRDALVDTGVTALNSLMSSHHQIDRKHYLNLIKQAAVDTGDAENQVRLEQASRARRKLYQMLKQLDNESGLPALNPAS